MYVCMYVYTYVCMYVCIYIYTHTHYMYHYSGGHEQVRVPPHRCTTKTCHQHYLTNSSTPHHELNRIQTARTGCPHFLSSPTVL